MEADLQLELTESASILRLAGSICAPVAARLLELSREAARGPGVEVRCAGVERIDASALQILLALAAALERQGKRLWLDAPSPALSAALSLCNLTSRLPSRGR